MTSIEGSITLRLNCLQVQLGSATFSRVQVGFPVKNYASLGLFIVKDIVSFDHQNETQNRKMSRERRGREGWNAMA